MANEQQCLCCQVEKDVEAATYALQKLNKTILMIEDKHTSLSKHSTTKPTKCLGTAKTSTLLPSFLVILSDPGQVQHVPFERAPGDKLTDWNLRSHAIRRPPSPLAQLGWAGLGHKWPHSSGDQPLTTTPTARAGYTLMGHTIRSQRSRTRTQTPARAFYR